MKASSSQWKINGARIDEAHIGCTHKSHSIKLRKSSDACTRVQVIIKSFNRLMMSNVNSIKFYLWFIRLLTPSSLSHLSSSFFKDEIYCWIVGAEKCNGIRPIKWKITELSKTSLAASLANYSKRWVPFSCIRKRESPSSENSSIHNEKYFRQSQFAPN